MYSSYCLFGFKICINSIYFQNHQGQNKYQLVHVFGYPHITYITFSAAVHMKQPRRRHAAGALIGAGMPGAAPAAVFLPAVYTYGGNTKPRYRVLNLVHAAHT